MLISNRLQREFTVRSPVDLRCISGISPVCKLYSTAPLVSCHETGNIMIICSSWTHGRDVYKPTSVLIFESKYLK